MEINNKSVSKIFGFEKKKSQKLPLYVSRISAGFPSPAEDFIERKLDLNEFLVKKPAATFFVQVEGDSMIGAGINSGDILIVDRSREVLDGKIIVAMLDGEFTVKRIKREKDRILLVAENKNYKPVVVGPDSDFEAWGVVTYVIHKAK